MYVYITVYIRGCLCTAISTLGFEEDLAAAAGQLRPRAPGPFARRPAQGPQA